MNNRHRHTQSQHHHRRRLIQHHTIHTLFTRNRPLISTRTILLISSHGTRTPRTRIILSRHINASSSINVTHRNLRHRPTLLQYRTTNRPHSTRTRQHRPTLRTNTVLTNRRLNQHRRHHLPTNISRHRYHRHHSHNLTQTSVPLRRPRRQPTTFRINLSLTRRTTLHTHRHRSRTNRRTKSTHTKNHSRQPQTHVRITTRPSRTRTIHRRFIRNRPHLHQVPPNRRHNSINIQQQTVSRPRHITRQSRSRLTSPNRQRTFRHNILKRTHRHLISRHHSPPHVRTINHQMSQHRHQFRQHSKLSQPTNQISRLRTLQPKTRITIRTPTTTKHRTLNLHPIRIRRTRRRHQPTTVTRHSPRLQPRTRTTLSHLSRSLSLHQHTQSRVNSQCSTNRILMTRQRIGPRITRPRRTGPNRLHNRHQTSTTRNHRQHITQIHPKDKVNQNNTRSSDAVVVSVSATTPHNEPLASVIRHTK